MKRNVISIQLSFFSPLRFWTNYHCTTLVHFQWRISSCRILSDSAILPSNRSKEARVWWKRPQRERNETRPRTCIIKGNEIDREREKREKKRGESIVHRCVRRAVKRWFVCVLYTTRRRWWRRGDVTLLLLSIPRAGDRGRESVGHGKVPKPMGEGGETSENYENYRPRPVLWIFATPPRLASSKRILFWILKWNSTPKHSDSDRNETKKEMKLADSIPRRIGLSFRRESPDVDVEGEGRLVGAIVRGIKSWQATSNLYSVSGVIAATGQESWRRLGHAQAQGHPLDRDHASLPWPRDLSSGSLARNQGWRKKLN